MQVGVGSAQQSLSRLSILEHAFDLTRVYSLADLSFSVLANDLKVTPALIYYYIKDRDSLISGVVNLFAKARAEQLGVPNGDWRTQIEAMSRTIFALNQRYSGVATYLVEHNRFRLFQIVAEGEINYSLALFEQMARLLQSTGLSPERVAMAYHLLMQHVVSSSAAQARHQLPSDHAAFIRTKLLETPVDLFPAVHYVADAFAQLSAIAAFEEGLALLLDGISVWSKV